ncbi:DUF2637 domain-containing protein [Amycolatopsis sp.]|jgi:hypothetical protein|uniref:DUF2637 domain-containing protein n=1 Tax=Amycolatopsis sp. TaxID=37632 RepID=UPI002E09B0FE|nr:DUF2637 domain-containing protein [Amycolatopsis sp.]
MSALDRAIVGAAGATVVGLAGVAGAISYSHMAELARLHGEVGWRSHAFPVSVDGIEVVASLVLLAHRRAGTRADWLPWVALAAGTAASVAANVAVGASDPVGRLVAGWPAVALLVAIKLLAGLLDARSEHGIGFAGQQGTAGPVRRSPGPSGPVAEGVGTGKADGGPETDGSKAIGPRRVSRDPASAGTDPIGLVDAALVVRDQLVAAGEPVNRRNLAAGLRASGHRVRNDRLGHLLQVVNAPGSQAVSPVGALVAVAGGEGRG